MCTGSLDLNYWHSRLIAGDAKASERLASLLLRALQGPVRSRPVARLSDSGCIADAIAEAIEHYLEHPTNFRPEAGPLVAYLAKSAENRLKDRRISESRRRQREGEAALAVGRFIDAQGSDGNNEFPDLIEFARPLCTNEELAFLRAVVERRSLAEKAATLGFQNGPSVQQRALVNRVRERLVKRLRRHAPVR